MRCRNKSKVKTFHLSKISVSDKTGQFYIIAAVVIVAVLFGSYAITTYVRTRPGQNTQDVYEELKLEGESVVNYGIFSEEPSTPDLDTLLTDFMSNYGNYVGSDYEFLFIYANAEMLGGSSPKVKVFLSKEISTGSISINLGDGLVELNIQTMSVRPEDVNVNLGRDGSGTITIDNRAYEVELTEGQNIFFILKQPI